MKLVSATLVLLFTLVLGCNKKPPVQSSNTASPPPPAVASQASSSQPRNLAPPPGQTSTGATLEEANAALHLWIMKRPNLPQDPGELVSAKFIKTLPTPPPGQKLAIDRQKMAVVFVEK